MPGSALELDEIVEVSDGYTQTGDFMLTTVSMMSGTISYYLYSFIDPYMETIPKEYVLNENEKQEDYSKRQEKVMKQSQDDAIIAAFKFLDYPIEINEKGIMVMGFTPGAPSEDILEVGDLITAVDDKQVRKVDDLLEYFKNKKANDLVEVEFTRNNKKFKEEIPLVNFSEQYEDETIPKDKVGIGIYPFNEREVIPSKTVIFHTEEIGGPSAGLMFTLEIIDQLIPEDLTKGYKIAGTGTIDVNGVVGQIGGAGLKVKAASESGAEIFFVPKDITEDDINQKEAEATNIDLGNPLKIVPVADLNEVIEYLNSLQQKTSS